MAKKEKLYTQLEWEFLEKKLKAVGEYIEANPLEDIDDRIETVTSSKGQPVVKVIAKKEDAVKSWLLVLKEFAILTGIVEELREKNAEKLLDVRKGSSINGLMDSKLKENE